MLFLSACFSKGAKEKKDKPPVCCQFLCNYIIQMSLLSRSFINSVKFKVKQRICPFIHNCLPTPIGLPNKLPSAFRIYYRVSKQV